MTLTFKEEWRVETIGGGITGTHDEVKTWVGHFHEAYGDTYDETIHFQRRFLTEWVDVEPDFD